MSITIPSRALPINANVNISGSKSITNRALLLAALARGESFLENMLFSEDTWALVAALQELGVSIDAKESSHTASIKGCGGRFPHTLAKLDCCDAGTVARFLIAVCATQSGEFKFDGSARLRQRPLKDLIDVLRVQGAAISSNALPLIMHNKRPLKGGNIFISSDKSSQFLSGLLISSPYYTTDVILETKHLVSEPYVDMTCAMMQAFGVEVIHHQKTWKIKAGQCYQSRTYQVEADFSSASYFFAAAAITAGKITVLNMKRENSLQGDSKFLTVLEKMGCIVQISNTSIAVIGPKQLQGVHVDMQDFSDTMMTLAAIAPFANSPTRIVNIGNTRLKESDRVAAMSDNLRRLGIRVDEEATALTIYPGQPSSGIITTYRDHRIAMACALIGLKVPGIVIDDPTCVNKTFPEFFKLFFSMIS